MGVIVSSSGWCTLRKALWFQASGFSRQVWHWRGGKFRSFRMNRFKLWQLWVKRGFRFGSSLPYLGPLNFRKALVPSVPFAAGPFEVAAGFSSLRLIVSRSFQDVIAPQPVAACLSGLRHVLATVSVFDCSNFGSALESASAMGVLREWPTALPMSFSN